jgi:hypothetical protein
MLNHTSAPTEPRHAPRATTGDPIAIGRPTSPLKADVASRRRAAESAGCDELGQLETAASAAKANASILQLETTAWDEDERSRRPRC